MSNNTKWALISVTDKTGLCEFATGLIQAGFQLLSTGGTAIFLRKHGISVVDVSELTKFEACFDGRVKTLHPKIHGAILFDRNNPVHITEQEKLDIQTIDLVCVNLYQFQDEAVAKNLSLSEAIEFIDIGGPTLLRAAAKNWQHCLPVCDPSDYDRVLDFINHKINQPHNFRTNLARKVFSLTAAYDQMIANFMADSIAPCASLPKSFNVQLSLNQTLRYGENPHQKAGYYTSSHSKLTYGPLLASQYGKELSFNNLLDLDSAIRLVKCFLPNRAVVVIKHNTPCGVAEGAYTGAQLIRLARECDPKSAFGGIFALNFELDELAAKELCTSFVECIAAPKICREAYALLSEKPNLRIIELPWIEQNEQAPGFDLRTIIGGILIQEIDQLAFADRNNWSYPTLAKPDSQQMADLIFANKIAAFAKSNAIVLAKNQILCGIGAGQTSRIDALNCAAIKSNEFSVDLKNAVMASDAFFPFADCVHMASQLGIKAIIQPGGSKKDEESIMAANEAGIAMIFTGQRHFRH